MDKKLDQHRIKEMLEAVIKVARGDFSAQLELSDKNDDLDSLAMAINMMIDDLKTNTIELKYAENRIEEISKIIQAVAKGDYSVLYELSNKNDIFDALGIGVNMMIDDIITGTDELIKSINEYEALNEEYKTQNEELFKAKAKVEESNEKYSNLVETIDEAIFVLDNKGVYKFINKIGANRLGYKQKEIIGMSLYDIFPKEIADFQLEQVKIACKSEKKLLTQNQSMVKNKLVWFEVRLKPVKNDEGVYDSVIGVVFNISKIKNFEIEITKAKEKAEEANLAKSKFLSSMSHELRTPLNSILGYNQILKKGKNITKEQKDQIDTVLRSGQHLLDLINDILDISKIEAGKQVLIPIDFNLPHMLNIVFNITKISAKEKGLYFHYNINTQIPEVVHNDKRKIEQILLNILSNAVKYTYNGGINFSVTTKKAGENIIIFKIEDTGIGISKENMKVIFKPFNQLGKIYNIGTGLGLPITKSLVELMKGKLSVSSTTGKGSCFTVELPFEIISHTAEKELRKTIELPGKKQQKEKKIPSVKILDNIINTTKKGDYRTLEQIINELRIEDKAFTIFCDKLNSLTKEYDEISIIEYMNVLKTNNRLN